MEPGRFRKIMSNVDGVHTTEELSPFAGFYEDSIPGDLETLIRKAIVDVDSNKAIGVDGVHVKMLKSNKKKSAKILKELWKSMGRTAQISRPWLQCTLIPVHKKGK